MITPIKQSDPRWANFYIGNSRAKMKRYGCYISCLCMALEKLRGYFCDPRDAVRFWLFTAQGKLSSKMKDFKGMTLVKKASYYDKKEVEKYANDPDKAAILVLDNGAHYVYVENFKGTTLTHIDPIDGEAHTYSSRLITGMRLLEKKDISAPEWMQKFIEKVKEAGLKITDPLEEATIIKIEEILFDLKIIDKKEGWISIGRWLVIMDKISKYWKDVLE